MRAPPSHFGHERLSIGVDRTIPIGGNFSFDFGAAGAALFARRNTELTAVGEDYSDNITLWNAEASAGMTYRFGAGAATVGYRVDAFWDVYTLNAGDLEGGNRITHGPFATLTIDLRGARD